MNKIQSNSSGGARIFRGSHCNEDYFSGFYWTLDLEQKTGLRNPVVF
jgi:hypothetical protein